MKRIDLHTHSTYSDGTYTPADIMRLAEEKGLAAVALTDHDTLDGLAEATDAAHGTGVEFINGVELSSAYGGVEIHIVGLFIDPYSAVLRNALNDIRRRRDRRNDQMLAKIRSAGIMITESDLQNPTEKNVITRAHFAKAIVEKGYLPNVREAFEKYLSPGRSTYVKRETFEAAATLDMIRAASGLSFLAHPLLYGMSAAAVEDALVSLKRMGLNGVESLYTSNSMADDAFLAGLSKKHRLLVTGGSDFHGENKAHTDLGYGRGGLFVPERVLDALKGALRP